MKQILTRFFMAFLLASLLLGCSERRNKDAVRSSHWHQFQRSLNNWKMVIESKDFRRRPGTDFLEYDLDLVKSLESVSNRVERLELIKFLNEEINKISYESMDYRQYDVTCKAVAQAYGAVMYTSYAIFKDVETAIEAWFSFVEHFNNEISRCRKNNAKTGGDKGHDYEYYEYRCILCENAKVRIFYLIDDYGSFATRYCQKYPSRKKEFVERVKKAIGRYPRWYAEEIKQK